MGKDNFKVIFSKFSIDRREDLKIKTVIGKKDNEKIVRKIATNNSSKEHIKRLKDYFEELSNAYSEDTFKMCPCEIVDDEVAEFKWLDGHSLSGELLSIINAKGKSNDADITEKIIQFFVEYSKRIKSVNKKEEFKSTEEFEKIFGRYSFEGEESTSVANIDFILDNIIVCSDGYYLIDYEWVFFFPIPLDFIVFRAILHSFNVASLGEEIIDRIYDAVGIDAPHREAFLELENNFQAYVKGDKKSIADLYPQMGQAVYKLGHVDWSKVLNKCTVFSGTDIIYTEEKYDNSFKYSFTVNDKNENDEICIRLNDKNGIIKIVSIKSEGKDISIKKHNAATVIENDYYFAEIPEIVISTEKNDGISNPYTIEVVYDIIVKNNDYIAELAKLMTDNNGKTLELAEKDKWINAYKERAEVAEKNAVDLNKQLYDIVEKYDKAIEENNRLSNEVKDCIAKYDDAYGAYTKVSGELQDTLSKYNDLAKAFEELRQNNEKLNQTLVEIDREKSEANAELNRIKSRRLYKILEITEKK